MAATVGFRPALRRILPRPGAMRWESRGPRRLRALTLAVWFALVLATPPASPAPSPPAACPADPPGLVPDEPLAALAAALRPGGKVEILAIGSASTVAEDGYPLAMLAALQAARPGVTFHLTRKGGRGEDAAAGLRRLTRGLAATPVTLVLWQVGTVDAVRGLRPDDLAETVDAGAARVRRHGADLVLIDPQFSRFLRANVDLEPYEIALQMAAAEPGVALFPRHAVMQAWAQEDGLDPERAGEAEAATTATLLRHCLGAALARFLLAGAGS
jgi:hypothetical protein